MCTHEALQHGLGEDGDEAAGAHLLLALGAEGQPAHEARGGVKLRQQESKEMRKLPGCLSRIVSKGATVDQCPRHSREACNMCVCVPSIQSTMMADLYREGEDAILARANAPSIEPIEQRVDGGQLLLNTEIHNRHVRNSAARLVKVSCCWGLPLQAQA